MATPIFTHQIALTDQDTPITTYMNQDLASPQETAFAENANPGFTVYTYAGDHNAKKRKFIEQVHRKVGDTPWGFLEFNSAEAFSGNKSELSKFTEDFLVYARANGVRIVAPLAWEGNSLDKGIKDSGVDDGIRKFITNPKR